MSVDRDSSAVSIHRHFDCAFPELWLSVTAPESISAWFTPCARGSGGRYRLRFTEDSGESYVKHATVLRYRLREDAGDYRFLLEDPGHHDSVVEVSVSGAPGGAVLTLRHLDPPAELADGYARGWADYLDSLERHLEASRQDAIRRPEGGR
ncbi:SRPBCC family protein [Nonomuraea harbinensis]|uniref:SRPBCC domain-containing protein n=1 Tax=Nonomuraea harbinensis TaxID=1286938 RepID=A0ABW1BZ23_9ACTN|nr:SRPBCC domain-containing protein [Nonomuraea harbinensis]